MSFFSEAAVKAGLGELSLADGYNIINYNGGCIYVEGIKRLIRIEGGEIMLELKGTILTIKGQDLSLSELSSAAIIKGVIDVMEFNHVKGKKNEKK